MAEYYWEPTPGRLEILDLDGWVEKCKEGVRVARTVLADGLVVSTVWLGLDHAFNSGPPRIYETMVFDQRPESESIGQTTTVAATPTAPKPKPATPRPSNGPRPTCSPEHLHTPTRMPREKCPHCQGSLAPRPRRKTISTAEIVRLRGLGLSWNDIAMKANRSTGTVWHRWKMATDAEFKAKINAKNKAAYHAKRASFLASEEVPHAESEPHA